MNRAQPEPTSETVVDEAGDDEVATGDAEPKVPKAKAGRKKGGKNKKKD
jgi:hypothetical protein